MDFIPFGYLFPEQGQQETRSLTIRGRVDLPEDEYGLLEYYCPEPECDCQMVLLTIVSRKKQSPVATVVYYFDSDDELPNPALDLSPQTSFAKGALRLVGEHLDVYPAYVSRLKKHYRQVKEAVSDPSHPAYSLFIQWQEYMAALGDTPKRKPSNRPKSARKQEPVPKPMQPRYAEIIQLTDAFFRDHLNDEYAVMGRKMAAALARKRPSPLINGKANIWACGIIYALGQVNFLFDQSQTPHMRADELSDVFGVSQSTAGNKAKQIRDNLKIGLMDPKWCLPGLLEHNPLVWMIEVDGLIVDVRNAPRELKEKAYREGLIPYIPEDRD